MSVVTMSKNQQDCSFRKLSMIAISAAVLASSFVIGSQLIQPSMAQDLGQMGQQAIKEFTGGNQTGNQTGNQSGGVLGQLGEKAKSMLPGQ